MLGMRHVYRFTICGGLTIFALILELKLTYLQLFKNEKFPVYQRFRINVEESKIIFILELQGFSGSVWTVAKFRTNSLDKVKLV